MKRAVRCWLGWRRRPARGANSAWVPCLRPAGGQPAARSRSRPDLLLPRATQPGAMAGEGRLQPCGGPAGRGDPSPLSRRGHGREARGTSRIGLAVSADGLYFERRPEPVLFPAEDAMKPYEWEGGCEDPRVVESEDGGYVMTYTAYDGAIARLAVATSRDLVTWNKQGLAFAASANSPYRGLWSKSGAVVCRRLDDGRLVATRLGGRYWMYWGDTDIFAATSDDLVHWTPVERESTTPRPVMSVRAGRFDSALVEPGPPALITSRGILLLYNAKNAARDGVAVRSAGRLCRRPGALRPARSDARPATRGDELLPPGGRGREGRTGPQRLLPRGPGVLPRPRVPVLRHGGLAHRRRRRRNPAALTLAPHRPRARQARARL